MRIDLVRCPLQQVADVFDHLRFPRVDPAIGLGHLDQPFAQGKALFRRDFFSQKGAQLFGRRQHLFQTLAVGAHFCGFDRLHAQAADEQPVDCLQLAQVHPVIRPRQTQHERADQMRRIGLRQGTRRGGAAEKAQNSVDHRRLRF